MMKAKSLLAVLLISAVTLSMFPNLANAFHYKYSYDKKKQAQKSGYCCKGRFKETTPACSTTAKMRFEQKQGDYCAGCQAAATYVEGPTGDHSKSWHEGFTDCRFNVYRSTRTEIQAEKTICGYSPCCR